MTTPTIAVIGAGNMGTSLIHGLINSGHPSESLWASDPSDDKLFYLQNTFKIHTTNNNSKAVQAANVVIFAIKPQVFREVAVKLSKIIQTHKPLVISIAAGVRIKNIERWLANDIAIVRCMPNTPSLIGCGATALYANTHVTQKEHSVAESILRAVGVIVWVADEALIDIVTALSGSGPAYFFLIMEILQQTAQEMGLPVETARLLTLQTALGAARMALETKASLTELRERVTSPGGTTEKAIYVLEENNIREIFKKALMAAKKRSEELSKMLGEN